MVSHIKILSDHLVNQIAAGEVVENPTSVVKELVENALDAGAHKIHVQIEGGGLQLIRVTDDGCGMEHDDAVLCFERHATSKLHKAEDLWQITTMGFRGEALAAIAAVGRVVLTTAMEKKEGIRIEIEGGKLLKIEPCGRAQGTTIEVRSLFYNVAARRKFQRSAAISSTEIQRLIMALSLCHPQRHLSLESQGVSLFDSERQGNDFLSTLRIRSQEVLGEEFASSALPVTGETPLGYSVKGWIGAPHHHRPQKTGQYLFLNDRYIAAPLVSFVVRDAYSTRLPEGRHPLFVLHLHLPLVSVDVNVHPQKKEVRFRDESTLRHFVRDAISASFNRPLPKFAFESKPSFWEDSDLSPPNFKSDDNLSPMKVFDQIPHTPNEEVLHTPEPIAKIHSELKSALLPSDSHGSQIAYPQLDMSICKPDESMTKSSNFSSEAIFAIGSPEPVGEIGKGIKIIGIMKHYLLIDADIQDTEGILFVDLLAIKRKLAFLETIKNLSQGSMASQRLLIPLKLSLTKTEGKIVSDRLDELRKIGIEIHPIAEETFLVEAIPPFLREEQVKEAILKCLEEFSDIKGDLHKRLAEQLSRYVGSSKHHFSPQEGEMLWKQLMMTEDPLSPYQGQKVVALLTQNKLQSLFK